MQPLPDDIPPNDVMQWIQGGVFLIRVNDRHWPAIMAEEPDPRRPFGLLKVLTQANGWSEVMQVGLREIFTHWPMCGAINPEQAPFAVIVNRLPRKQFMRTFNPGQCQVNIPRYAEMVTKYGREVTNSFHCWSAPVIAALFEPTYPTYAEARRMLEDRSSVALSPLLIMLRDDFGKSVLYYRGRPAAAISNGGRPRLLSKCMSAGVIAELLNERK